MPRRSLRQSAGSAHPAASKRPSSPQSTPTRQSKRTRVSARSKATPTKSQYFEQEPEDVAGPEQSEPDDTLAKDESAYEDEDVAGIGSSTQSDDSSEGDAYASDECPAPKKRGLPQKPARMTKATAATGRKGKELWRAGVDTGLEPGTKLIIKKPKPREAGDTPYTDDTIHPNTMLFLKDLAGNNDREWLKMHDPDYRTSLKDFNSFVERLTERVIEADDTIPELPTKDIVFRIYRDIRFSSDPTPYKTHFAAAWSRTGRKGPYAAYYVHIEPNANFVGGGLWMPAADSLQRLRREIDLKPHKIKRVLNDVNIRKEFFDGIPNDEKAAVRAFTKKNAESALKVRPQGYEKDHRDIELLRLRSFTIGTKLDDRAVVGAGGLQRIADLIACMVPFITYLNSVVMPDAPSSGDGSGAEGDE
ncbi:protein fam92a1 [Diplodia corticola]|uniref:Protein fam92a1 n=1 Tax=Diplodia corticola TaxID=236234 RepID=A0A1J9R1D6_9PEZI|nr:protein fam92a1 [Diplodia corticola]OJD35206.1 protein fam92a1 [Diplodia corticola]